MTAVTVERVTFRRVSASLAFADVRLPGVHLLGIRVETRDRGEIAVRVPERIDQQGRAWPAFVLQPGTREAVEGAIASMWARAPA